MKNMWQSTQQRRVAIDKFRADVMSLHREQRRSIGMKEKRLKQMNFNFKRDPNLPLPSSAFASEEDQVETMIINNKTTLPTMEAPQLLDGIVNETLKNSKITSNLMSQQVSLKESYRNREKKPTRYERKTNIKIAEHDQVNIITEGSHDCMTKHSVNPRQSANPSQKSSSHLETATRIEKSSDCNLKKPVTPVNDHLNNWTVLDSHHNMIDDREDILSPKDPQNQTHLSNANQGEASTSFKRQSPTGDTSHLQIKNLFPSEEDAAGGEMYQVPKICGIKFYMEKLEASKALQARCQNMIPTAKPVVLDQRSFNFSNKPPTAASSKTNYMSKTISLRRADTAQPKQMVVSRDRPLIFVNRGTSAASSKGKHHVKSSPFCQFRTGVRPQTSNKSRTSQVAARFGRNTNTSEVSGRQVPASENYFNQRVVAQYQAHLERQRRIEAKKEERRRQHIEDVFVPGGQTEGSQPTRYDTGTSTRYRGTTFDNVTPNHYNPQSRAGAESFEAFTRKRGTTPQTNDLNAAVSPLKSPGILLNQKRMNAEANISYRQGQSSKKFSISKGSSSRKKSPKLSSKLSKPSKLSGRVGSPPVLVNQGGQAANTVQINVNSNIQSITSDLSEKQAKNSDKMEAVGEKHQIERLIQNFKEEEKNISDIEGTIEEDTKAAAASMEVMKKKGFRVKMPKHSVQPNAKSQLDMINTSQGISRQDHSQRYGQGGYKTAHIASQISNGEAQQKSSTMTNIPFDNNYSESRMEAVPDPVHHETKLSNFSGGADGFLKKHRVLKKGHRRVSIEPNASSKSLKQKKVVGAIVKRKLNRTATRAEYNRTQEATAMMTGPGGASQQFNSISSHYTRDYLTEVMKKQNLRNTSNTLQRTISEIKSECSHKRKSMKLPSHLPAQPMQMTLGGQFRTNTTNFRTVKKDMNFDNLFTEVCDVANDLKNQCRDPSIVRRLVEGSQDRIDTLDAIRATAIQKPLMFISGGDASSKEDERALQIEAEFGASTRKDDFQANRDFLNATISPPGEDSPMPMTQTEQFLSLEPALNESKGMKTNQSSAEYKMTQQELAQQTLQLPKSRTRKPPKIPMHSAIMGEEDLRDKKVEAKMADNISSNYLKYDKKRNSKRNQTEFIKVTRTVDPKPLINLPQQDFFFANSAGTSVLDPSIEAAQQEQTALKQKAGDGDLPEIVIQIPNEPKTSNEFTPRPEDFEQSLSQALPKNLSIPPPPGDALEEEAATEGEAVKLEAPSGIEPPAPISTDKKHFTKFLNALSEFPSREHLPGKIIEENESLPEATHLHPASALPKTIGKYEIYSDSIPGPETASYAQNQLAATLGGATSQDAEVLRSINTSVAARVQVQLQETMKEISLDDMADLDQDDLRLKIFDKYAQIYAQIRQNAREYGYAKSPDFKKKADHLRKINEKRWLESRGFNKRSKSIGSPKTLIRHSLEIVPVMDRYDNFKVLHPNDLQTFMDPLSLKSNVLSQDQINSEISAFSRELFCNWLEDYANSIEMVKETNLQHHRWALNEGALKNIKDQCLPIDYFMEKCLQAGLCTSMKSLQIIIEMVLLDGNAGHVQQTPPPDWVPANDIPGYEEDPLIYKAEFASTTQLGRRDGDSFVPLNSLSYDAERFIRLNLDKNQFKRSDRISLHQFLSLFSINGVQNSKKIDQLIVLLKKRLIDKRLKSKFHEKQVEIQEKVKKAGSTLMTSPMMSNISSQPRVNEAAEFKEDLKQMSPFQRRLTGKASHIMEKQKIMKKLQMLSDLSEDIFYDENIFSFELDQFMKKKRDTVSSVSDQRYYDFVMAKFREITKNVYNFERQQDLPDLDVKMGNAVSPSHFIKQISKESFKEMFHKERLEMEEEAKLRMAELNVDIKTPDEEELRVEPISALKQSLSSFDTQKSCQSQSDRSSSSSSVSSSEFSREARDTVPKEPASGSPIPSQKLGLQKQRTKTFFRDPFQNQSPTRFDHMKRRESSVNGSMRNLQKFFLDQMASMGISPTNQTASPQQRKSSTHLQLKRITKIRKTAQLRKKSTMDSLTLEMLRKKEQLDREREEAAQYNSKYYQAYKKVADSLEIIRKQMVLVEICGDLVKIREIIEGLLKYDSVQGAEQQPNNLRTHYRQQFSKFVMKDIREKYSHQLFLFYKGDEGRHGMDISNGVSVKMKKKALHYGIRARSLLLHIVALMIKHNIKLTDDNFHFNPKKTSLSKTAAKLFEPSNAMFGWLQILKSQKDVQLHVNKLVNLIIEQINDREQTVFYPNEDQEELLSIGINIWYEKIDPGNILCVPRRHLDDFLVEANIVKDYKEVKLFLSGVLNKLAINRQDDLKKSAFIKLIMKTVLRDTVKKIMTFNSFGIDTSNTALTNVENAKPTIPFSHKIQKFQRFILFSGIKTKNSQGVDIKDRKDFLERSNACMEIVSNLQALKSNKKYLTLDKCKLNVQEQMAWLKKNADIPVAGHKILSDLEVAEWEKPIEQNEKFEASRRESLQMGLTMSKQSKANSQAQKREEKESGAEVNEEQQENIARIQASIHEKDVMKKLLVKPEVFQGPLQIMLFEKQLRRPIDPLNKVLNLPQVRMALKKSFPQETYKAGDSSAVHSPVEKDGNYELYEFGKVGDSSQEISETRIQLQDSLAQEKKLAKIAADQQNNIITGFQRIETEENQRQKHDRLSLIQRQRYLLDINRELLKNAAQANKEE